MKGGIAFCHCIYARINPMLEKEIHFELRELPGTNHRNRVAGDNNHRIGELLDFLEESHPSLPEYLEAVAELIKAAGELIDSV